MRSRPTSPTTTTPARRCSSPTRGGSTRTAGRPAATGSTATLIDLVTGERRPTRDRLAALVERLGVELPAGDGAARQREIAAERGLEGLVAWLSDRFAE